MNRGKATAILPNRVESGTRSDTCSTSEGVTMQLELAHQMPRHGGEDPPSRAPSLTTASLLVETDCHRH